MSQRESDTISTLLDEQRRYPPDPAFAAQANAGPEIYDLSLDELWEREGRDRVSWFTPFSKLYEWEPPYAKWYLGGRLNVCFNCVDRHVEAGAGDRVAYHWEGEPEGDRRTITFADLQRDVVRFANGLRRDGRAQGHARRHLHGHGPRAADRHAGVCAARGAAHGRLRRVLGRGPLRSHERHGVRGPDHAGRGLARRSQRAPQAERRSGSRAQPRGSPGRRASTHRWRDRHASPGATAGGTS